MNEHLAHDGVDPRYVTRKELLAEGLPLKAQKTVPVPKQAPGPFALYQAEKNAERVARAEVLPKSSHAENMRQLGREFKTLDQASRGRYFDMAEASFARKDSEFYEATHAGPMGIGITDRHAIHSAGGLFRAAGPPWGHYSDR